MSESVVRALTAADRDAARALVQSSCGGSRHHKRTMELLDQALGGNDAECLGIVRTTDGVVDAVILHGLIAGASGVEKVHALFGSSVDALMVLVDALQTRLRWRMIVCELAEESSHAIAAAALVHQGFTREGSVSAFFDETTDLVLYVLHQGPARG